MPFLLQEIKGRISMQKFFFIFVTVFSVTNLCADFFTDTFFTSKKEELCLHKADDKTKMDVHLPTIDFNNILPRVDEKNPHFSFTCNKNECCLDNSFFEKITLLVNDLTLIEINVPQNHSIDSSNKLFKHIHIIDKRPEMINALKKNKPTNVTIHSENIKDALSQIKKITHENVLFYINPSNSDKNSSQSEQKTILYELEMIQSCGFTNALFIIDNTRLFYTSFTSTAKTFTKNYPALYEILTSIRSITSDYQCALIFDSLFVFPHLQPITVSPVVKAITLSRLYDNSNYSLNDIIEAELCIARSTNNEKEALKELATDYVDSWTEKAGLARHIPLWFGLSLMSHQNFKDAQAQFWQARIRAQGNFGWRLDWYQAMAEAECFFGIR